jgi:DNA-binding NtrC family response regulator
MDTDGLRWISRTTAIEQNILRRDKEVCDNMFSMSSKILLAWIGNTDLRAATGDPGAGLGPIGQAVSARPFDQVVLLSNFPREKTEEYRVWLGKQTPAEVRYELEKLSSPTHFGEIYEAARAVLSHVVETSGSDAEFIFHLSPGTPAMAAVWIILAKTRFPAELIESSQAHGVRTASVPFDISADFIPDLLRRSDDKLTRLAQGAAEAAPGFEEIVHRSPTMRRTIEQARRIAVSSVSVLIEGESGTGKELMARAIHRASPRRDKPFVAVNCGAIPRDLAESEFFGHVKGAFTGASSDREGHFEKARGGTLFLDEIGELPLPLQVKLLRALQEREVTRIGSSKPIPVDVRIVAATNRNLLEEISQGSFREDLFYRLAVAILKLPPVRERSGDLSLLIDTLLAKVNDEARTVPGYKEKKLSAGAKNLMLKHPWPGNVRELLNTLQRVCVSTDEETIGTETVKESLLDLGSVDRRRDPVLGRNVTEGVDLQEILGDVARHYIRAALRETDNNKTQAAKLLALSNYQTLSNWMARYDVSE